MNITENGKLVAGTFLMPQVGLSANGFVVFNLSIGDLMSTLYRFASTRLGEHSVNGLNLVAGRRTPYALDRFGNLIDEWSNATAPGNYVRLLPKTTDVALTDVASGAS